MKNNEYSIQVNNCKIITEAEISNSLNVLESVCKCFNSCRKDCPFSDSRGSCQITASSSYGWNINKQDRVYKAFNF